MVQSVPKPAALFFPSGILLSWALNIENIVRLHIRSQKAFRSQNVHVIWDVVGRSSGHGPWAADVSSCCKGPCVVAGGGMFPGSAHYKPSLDTTALHGLLG